jgi:hypothetical protein
LQSSDPILFHVLHDDGDNEDLDLQEIDAALALYSTIHANNKGAPATSRGASSSSAPSSMPSQGRGRGTAGGRGGGRGAGRGADRGGGAAARRGAKRKVESADDEETEEEDEEDDDEDASDDEDDDDDDEGETGPTSTLWPSLEARNRWQQAVEDCQTTGALALAIVALRDHAAAFGCV